LGASAVWCVAEFWRRRWQVRRAIAAFSIGLAGPILAFEATKIGVLGWAGYRDNVNQFRAILPYFHVRPVSPFETFVQILRDEYVIRPAMMGVLSLSLAVLLILAARPSWRKHEPIFGLMLFGGAIAHLLYFLLLSRMSGKYLWPSVALLAFAAPSPIIFGGWRLAVPGAAIILVFLATPQSVLDSYNIQLRGTDGRVTREQRMALAAISEYPDLPIVSSRG
jgi:hypothetical protein